MRMITAAILTFDLVVGLLLFGLWEDRGTQTKKAVVVTAPADADPARWQESPSDVEPKKIALTFDDGPHPLYTEQLLDGLQERDVRVTFFVTGEHAQMYPDLIRRMQEEGHLIGNHTYSHMQLTRSNRSAFREELIRTNDIIEEITGEEVEFVRPPYGSWDKAFEKELNMFPVLWTVDPVDWNTKSAERIVRKVLRAAGENDVILMHDYYSTSVDAALQIVDALTQKGYTFVTVEELMFE